MIYTRLIKIGPSLYLTDTGLIGGLRIITDVTGPELLKEAYVGPVRTALSGKPFEFVRQNTGAGVLIKIHFNRIPSDVLDDIITLHDSSKSGNADIPLVITGGPDDIAVNVRAGGEGVKPVERGSGYSDQSGLVFDTTLNYTVSSFIP